MIVGAFESTFPFRMTASALPPRTRTDTLYMPAIPTAASTSTPSPSGLRNLKCGYPSKICTNERAWKRDGSLHRFCEDHRARANTNQKRWAQRKSRTKTDKAGGASAPQPSSSKSFIEEYQVDDSMLQAKSPMDFTDFDMTLDALLKDASFWSPTAAACSSFSHQQWECEEIQTQTIKEEDEMEAELWAALGLGNINMSL